MGCGLMMLLYVGCATFPRQKPFVPNIDSRSLVSPVLLNDERRTEYIFKNDKKVKVDTWRFDSSYHHRQTNSRNELWTGKTIFDVCSGISRDSGFPSEPGCLSFNAKSFRPMDPKRDQ